jgi:anti-sigma B factor antagonist
MSLELHVSTAGRDTVVTVGGEIDVATAPQLRDCPNQTINAGSRQLVIDLRRVSFLDSMGLGVLVGARRRLLAQAPDPATIKLCANGLAMRILRLTGLDRVFPVYASLAEALDGQQPTPEPA